MSIVAEYRIDAPGYRAITDTLRDGRLTLEGEVACNSETVSLTFWTDGVDPEAFESDIQDLNAVIDSQRWSEQIDGQTLFHVRLPAFETTYWERVGLDGMLLEGRAQNGEWVVRSRFPDREALVDFRTECAKRDIGFSLGRLSRATACPEWNAEKLTEAQQSLLTTALEEGYFEVPRGITLSELADRFGISDQAASERLRRGLTNKLKNSA